MKIKDTNINFVQYGNEQGKDIVLLHGWGQNIEMMDPLGRRLQDDFKITIVDLPGFGESSEPPYAWTMDDYLEAFKLFLEELHIKEPILVGHSFGGRIAMMYAATEKVKKLVLFGSPFRRTNKKATLKMKFLKMMKKVPLVNKLEGYMKTKIGSRDYRNATPVMRQIVVNTVNYDYLPYIPKIKCSTLLIWGSNDTEVPLSEAKYLENNIKDSGLIVYEGCTHFAYLERLDQTINIINEFLKNERGVK